MPRPGNQRGPRGAHPTPILVYLSMPGGVSCQQVACFFPLLHIPGWVLPGHVQGERRSPTIEGISSIVYEGGMMLRIFIAFTSTQCS
ncbi:MAG: hypothetical protein JO125_10065 [Chloroflexi bacterium]|nr:hypothetical protein [Ktedonobacteraceae bacterium]MBV9021555.1 hypothetical protein [Ktedonobacteraceae bacterium]MBV9707740.1 hypothetical protein [Chloroflexota bacterium]